ncbi:MAG: alkaline phosphatase [Turicibacter sp.]
MFKRLLSLVLCAGAVLTLTTGCGTETSKQPEEILDSTQTVVENNSEIKTPKYVFMFIGDGMSQVQVNAAQVYLGNNTYGEVELEKLNFTQFPIAGIVTTQDSTSFAPDSASTATSLSSGAKTHSGVIGLGVDKEQKLTSISEMAKQQGMKVGVVSTVTINHATPAAYYAHVPSRSNYYDIGLQMAASNFDYFAGGAVSQATGKEGDQQDIVEILKENGYTIPTTKEEILALDSNSGKVYAQNPDTIEGAMLYSIDQKEGDLSLANFVEKGIDVLKNDNGFFMMVESGKVDWACHANDAMSAIQDVVGFADSIQVAMDFATKYPDETLIVVTGDHETGGMSIGYSTTGYDTAFDILSKQKMSYEMFDLLVADMKEENKVLTLDDMMPVIKENFGLMAPTDKDAQKEENSLLVLTDYEYSKLEAAFEESMKQVEERTQNQEMGVLYGGYDPLSVTLTHLINNKAGVGWTTYSHTGTPVALHAMGAGSELFAGSYDNTDVFHKLTKVMGLTK